MKKLLCLLTALLMLVCAGGAIAESVRFIESSSTFDIEMELPEGAKIVSSSGKDDLSIINIASEGLAEVSVTIAPSELYGDNSLNDLSDDDINALAEQAGLQYEAPKITVEVTPSGNKYIHICSNGESDVDSIFTLYDGFFIEMTQWHENYAELSEKDFAFMQQLLYNLEFIPLN